jgi:ethanolamine utilization protein EutA
MVATASIISTGIDVGTTSTHLTLSELTLSNRSAANQAPHLAISKREILYQSPIYLTPVSEDGVIDAAGVAEIIAAEYASAGIESSQVRSGAAIITGESARLRNAEEVIHALAGMAGDFVAASAGPHLESVLAARGSGAARASLETRRNIVNVDIGGGTANIAVYAAGELMDTACVGIGGRFMRLGADRTVLSISESGEVFLDGVARAIRTGDSPTEAELEHLGRLLAEAILRCVLPGRPPQISRRLLVTEPLSAEYAVDEYWFSGGVAELMKEPASEPLLYGDMGAHLAAGLVGSLREREIAYHVPEHPIRATVIGAGLHSLQLSGSTVSVKGSRLPLTNITIVRPFAHPLVEPDLPDKIRHAVASCLFHHDLDWSSAPLALVVEQVPELTFDNLSRWASGLAAAFRELNGCPPLIVVTRQDMAMALGQLVQKVLPGERVIVLDGISCQDGDYIDIGSPLAGGQAIPVVIKSLIFHKHKV